MNYKWLRTFGPTVLAITIAWAPLAAQQTGTPAAAPAPTPAADSADVATPESLLTALYDVISGPASEARDWDRFRSLFLPGARLVYSQTTPAGDMRLHPMTVEDFVRIVTPIYASGGGFWERDIGHRIDRFGNVAHVFTAYETRRDGPDAPVWRAASTAYR